MKPSLRAALLALAVLPCVAAGADAQRVERISWDVVREVMPQADRFDDATGDPPVVAGYVTDEDGQERLVGYVFLTSDLPPEQYGYSGPIEALVGMTLDGTLTGVRVTDYRESYMQQMGDFLRRRGFQEQFAGKYIGDPFRVWGDVDGISRVTISVRALSRGVRDASRRVAMAYSASASGPVAMPEDPVTDVVGMSWFEMRRLGVVERFEVTEPGEGSAGISLAYISSDRVGEYFYGRIQYESALRSMARRDGAEHLMLYAVDGSRLRLFLREGWSIAQAGDTTAIDPGDVVMLGLPSGGVVSGEATMVGVMLVKRMLDIRQPFTFIYDLGELGVHTVEYTTQDARVLMAEAAAEAEAAAAEAAAAEAADAEEGGGAADEESGGAAAEAEPAGAGAATAATDPGVVGRAGAGTAESGRGEAPGAAPGEARGGETSAARDPADDPEGQPSRAAVPGPEAAGATPVEEPAGAAALPPGPDGGPAGAAPSAEAQRPDRVRAGGSDAGTGPALRQARDFDFLVTEEESFVDRALANVSWWRVATMLLVLAVGTWAFFAKSPRIRWLSLAVTLGVLGYVNGGFLSVSHITSGIWAGPGVYLRDVPLLLIAAFTVAATLLWGRVFCGFLCPFGALQDFIDRVVPKRLQRELPAAAHDRALYVKYGILGVIVLPALAGSHASFYQYFEPFGTVFFGTESLLFWSIAVGFLLASAVVPRFYCRYACPLGAALAIGSLVSLNRITRVEQCRYCKVCEHACPTGAIRGADIDFKECVRCNLCEVQLLEQRGVCRHDMEAIRPRLVQLRLPGPERRGGSPEGVPMG